MKKFILFGIAAILMAGCTEKPIATIEMTCGTVDIIAIVYGNHINALVEDQNIKLDKTIAASGVRYESKGSVLNGIILWNKGDQWLLFLTQEDEPTTCVLKTIETPTRAEK